MEDEEGNLGFAPRCTCFEKQSSIEYLSPEELNCYTFCIASGISPADALILVWGDEVFKLANLSSVSRKYIKEAVKFFEKSKKAKEEHDILAAKIYQVMAASFYLSFKVNHEKDLAREISSKI